MATFTEQERILKAKISLNRSKPFYSHILMSMRIERSKSNKMVPTMGVNEFGRLYWNEDFTSKLNDNELTGVLAHEAMHMAMLTFPRKGNRDHMIWNMATDAVINYIIITEGMELPKAALIPNTTGILTLDGKDGSFTINLNDKTAEEVYEEMLDHSETIYSKYGGLSGEDGQGDGGYKGGLDSHIEGDKDSEGKKTGEDKGSASKKANTEKWKKEAVEAATAAKMKGNLSASLERMLGNILEPKIDWKKKLSQFVTKDIPVNFTMRRPGRRSYSTGIYFPSVIKENLEVIVGVDISGSISGAEYDEFIGECCGIASGFEQIKMRMIWWSTYVDERDDLEVNGYEIDKVKEHTPFGGGGTEMSSFAKHIEKKGYNSQVYVILTDGHIEAQPEVPDGNILFVLSKGGTDEIIKKYGFVCKLSDVDNGI